MYKNINRLFTFAAALVVAVVLWGALATGTAQTQSTQPSAPTPGLHHDRMGYGNRIQAGVPVTGTETYAGWGHAMMGHQGMMGNGMMGGQGMMGNHMMGNGMMGHGMVGNGMMSHGMMGYALGNSVTVTDTEYASPVSIPESFVAALESADSNRGQQLTVANACLGCHSLDPNQMMAGPTWHDLAATAVTRVEGQKAAEYLYTSIVHPNAYVVSGYQRNVMSQRYGQTLSEQDIADIVKYLLTPDGER